MLKNKENEINEIKSNKKFYSIWVISIFALIFLLVAIISINNIKASPEPPVDGDWFIEKDEDVNLTKNHTMRGNVFVDGNLTIDGNYTLEFDCANLAEPPRAFGIYVNITGNLIMKNGAEIKSLTPTNPDYRMTMIRIFGSANITNSKINGVLEGVVCEENSTINITYTTFRNCTNGIIATGIRAPEETNVFISTDYDIVQYWKLIFEIYNENDDPITKGTVNLTNTIEEKAKRNIDKNSTANFGYVQVRKGDTIFTPFYLIAGIHIDEVNGTPHLTYENPNLIINKNYDMENPYKIIINDTYSPDFSIRFFSCNTTYMEVSDTNQIYVRVRNMGEIPSNAQIKFYIKEKGDSDFELLTTLEKEIPSKTRYPHHKITYDWKPIKDGDFLFKVEVSPSEMDDIYIFDDNSPSSTIIIFVMKSAEIEITKIDGKEIIEDSIYNGLISVEGNFYGSFDRIQIWMNEQRWQHIFNLDFKFGKYFEERNISHELKDAFYENLYNLRSSANILKIDKGIWEIIDNKINYKVVNTSTHLQVYYGLFIFPNKINYLTNTWTCLIDTGAYRGSNHKIYANISGEGYLYYDEDFILVNLDNKPEILLNSPNDKQVFTAYVENDEIYVGGFASRVSPKAPEIKEIILIINNTKRDVNLEKINDTHWKWNNLWNIASKTNPVKDGKYKIQVYCNDTDERYSEILEINVNIDNKASVSSITIPKIHLISKEPESFLEQDTEIILIKGYAEDDYMLKKIEAKINNGNWFYILNNIDANKLNWEYSWDIRNLKRGRYTIKFRAVDDEKDNEIIERYYPTVSYNITKNWQILPDLLIDNIIVKKNDDIPISQVNNSDEITFEINIRIKDLKEIPNQIKIYFKILHKGSTIGITEKTIDETISEKFAVSIPWTVIGEKGIQNFTIQIDVGNLIDEKDESNNKEDISLKILDNPTVNEENGDKSELNTNVIAVILIIVLLSIVFILILIFVNQKSQEDEKI